MEEYLKPSEYSAQVGLHYRTVIKHFYKGFNSEIMDNFVSIVTSFCGRIYGSNRKRKTIAIIESLKG